MGVLGQKRLQEEDSKFSREKSYKYQTYSPDCWGGSEEGYFGNQGTGQRSIILAVARSQSTTRWRTNVMYQLLVIFQFRLWAFLRHVTDGLYCSLQLHNHSVQQM